MDSRYRIYEFCLVFFFSGGRMRKRSLGSVHSFYIHGHAWLSDWDVSGGGGWGQGLLPGPPLEDPIPAAGPGVWVGEPSPVVREQPLPGHCPLLEGILEAQARSLPFPLPTVWSGGRGSR